MAIKRKCSDDVSPINTKHMKLVVAFPADGNSSDTDVEMSDAEPVSAHQPYHARVPSDASSNSSESSPANASPPYPTFDLYPTGPAYSNYHSYAGYNSNTTNVAAPVVGILQPQMSNQLTQHGAHCTQIPKLRIACMSGVTKTRSLWSHCEQCGHVAMH